MEDLRFLQHFILTAYPPMPLHGDAVWKDVTAMSHEVSCASSGHQKAQGLLTLTRVTKYDYLVHAMLGLAASHLSLCSGVNYSLQALRHRVRAIKSLNCALGRPCASQAEGDARFGAAMALTFQSSYMPDGMMEFLTMMRGCHVVAVTVMPSFEDSLFHTFSLEGHFGAVRRLVTARKTNGQDERMVDGLLASLREVVKICEGPLEIRFLIAMERVVELARVSSTDGSCTLALSLPCVLLGIRINNTSAQRSASLPACIR